VVGGGNAAGLGVGPTVGGGGGAATPGGGGAYEQLGVTVALVRLTERPHCAGTGTSELFSGIPLYGPVGTRFSWEKSVGSAPGAYGVTANTHWMVAPSSEAPTVAVKAAGVEPLATETLAGSVNSTPEPKTVTGAVTDVGAGTSTTQALSMKATLGVEKEVLKVMVDGGTVTVTLPPGAPRVKLWSSR
jgi:hypothetical protein